MIPHDVRSLLAWVRMDVVTLVMLLLVGSVGFVIVRFSRTYLEGSAGLPRYYRWLFVALGAVTTLVVSKNLLVIALAWHVTSLAIHRLLTFFPDRAPAIIAAHKKFLVSRLADLCLAASLLLVHREVGSFDLDRIDAWTRAHPELGPSMHIAALLVVLAVALRSAQLPFHGWLIQVMEAPTPVSALLHAGVVNIGGFVLIRLATWMAAAAPARMLLLVIGLFTTVVSALVMTTRVSVKVALAWSTCAQMGFMLVECGLGAWHLALLHLVAHSLYKAHAFLSAGGTVERWQARPPTAARRPAWTSAVVAIGAAAAGAAVFALSGGSLGVVTFLLGLTVGPLLVRRGGVMSAFAVAVLAVGAHLAAARLLPEDLAQRGETDGAWALAALAFAGLFMLKSLIVHRPAAPWARRLYPWLFAGLYLDETFTRYAFQVWPPRRAGRKRESTAAIAPATPALEV